MDSSEQRSPRSADDENNGGDIASGFGAPKRAGEPISDERAAHMDLRRPGHESGTAEPGPGPTEERGS